MLAAQRADDDRDQRSEEHVHAESVSEQTRRLRAGPLPAHFDAEHAARLQEFVANEVSGHIVLDLKEVTLVGQAAVRFLARVEAEGIRIMNCPGYVRSWIAAERESRSSGRSAEQGDEQ